MPNYKKHLFYALVVYYLILLFILFYGQSVFDLNNAIIWLLAILSGSLFPDIDIKSKGQRLFYFIFLFIVILSLICKNYHIAISITLFSFVPILAKHRGLFHNVWFLIMVILIVSKILINYFPEYRNLILSSCAFFAIGAKLHIFLDFNYKKLFKK